MRNVDDRLRDAATETREYAAQQWPKPPARFVKPAPRPRGWLVFATAFAAVILAFVTLPWLAGREQSDVASQPESLSTPTTVASPLTTPTDVADGDCSVAGAPIPEPVDGLPTPVAEMRAAIVDAALRCDIEALIDIAGPGFTASFGGGDAESFRTLEQSDQGRLDILLRILAMSHTVVDDGQGGEDYVWPVAYGYETWEEIPPEVIEELSSLYSDAELDQFSGFGQYGGWRTGIDENGDWMYFVAGD